MKKLRWSPAAADDLELISSYLHSNHPAYASQTIQKIYSSAKSLKQFPEKGRPGRIDGTRELVLAPLPYLIVYGIKEEIIQVLRIFHAAQDRR